MDTSSEFYSKSSHISIESVSLKKKFCISKNGNLIFGFLFFAFVWAVLVLYSESSVDLINEEKNVLNDSGELRSKEQHMNLFLRTPNEETISVLNNVNDALSSLRSNVSVDSNIKQIFANFSKISASYSQAYNVLKPPTDFHFLPHLLSDVSILRPRYHLSKNRSGVSAVIGVPTVKRPQQSYLIPTLNDLIEKMNNYDKEDTLIVIFIAEVDENSVFEIANDIKSQFEEEIDSGLIDIISPRASYYPDFDKLQLTLSDPKERVHWRSKQCLDFAFLMMYCYPKGQFYIQLEDDILTKNNFLSVMKNTALTRIHKNQQWFVLDFCQLGFIGKMFRSVDLPYIIQFLFMFFNDKPVDWLLDSLIQTKSCNLEKDVVDCKIQKDKLWVREKPSLFQHVGTVSSLKGKVQKLKDPFFGETPLFYPHLNPPATIQSSIQPVDGYTIQSAYSGETFFWGLQPQSGDWISFVFDKPIKIKKYRFRSGNVENPSDKFSNTSVLAHFVSSIHVTPPSATLSVSKISSKIEGPLKNNNVTVVGTFNRVGIAEASFNDTVSPVKELRLVFHSATKSRVILSEILIQE